MPLQEPLPLLSSQTVEDLIEFAVLQNLLRVISVETSLCDVNITTKEQREELTHNFGLTNKEECWLSAFRRNFPREMQRIKEITVDIEAYIFNRCRELGMVFLSQALDRYPNLVNSKMHQMNAKLTEIFHGKLLASTNAAALKNINLMTKRIASIAYDICNRSKNI